MSRNGDKDRDRDDEKDRDREHRHKRDKKDKERDRDRSRDRDRDKDREKEKDRHHHRSERGNDKERSDKDEKDRDERKERERKDRDRSRDGAPRDNDDDKDREERRERRRKEKEREKDKERDHRDDEPRSEKGRDRDRDRSRDRDRDKDRERDRDKEDKQKDRNRDRSENGDRKEKRDKREDRKHHKGRDKDDKLASSSAETGKVLIDSAAGSRIPSRSATPTVVPAVPHTQVGIGGVQPSGTFGNMFMLGGGGGASGGLLMNNTQSYSTAPINSNNNTNNHSIRSTPPPPSAAAMIKMMSDDSSDDGNSKEKRKKKRGADKESGRRRDGSRSPPEDGRSKNKSSRRHRDRSGGSSSSSEEEENDKRGKKSSSSSHKNQKNGNGTVNVLEDTYSTDPDKLATIVAVDSLNATQNGAHLRGGNAHLTRNVPAWKIMPPHALQLGFLKREKAGLFSSKGDKFTFFLEPSRRFVIAARRRARKNTPNYLISTDAGDLARDSDKFNGKVRANYTSTEYVFYDNGASPEDFLKAKAKLGAALSLSNNSELLPRIRREIGAAIFEHPAGSSGSILKGTTQPRKIIILLPSFNPTTGEPTIDWCQHVGGSQHTAANLSGGINSTQGMMSGKNDKNESNSKTKGKNSKKDDSHSDEDSDDARDARDGGSGPQPPASAAVASANGSCFSLLIQAYTNAQKNAAVPSANASNSPYPADVVVLNNKTPQWNEAAKAFQLNFKGRVGVSSIKNFQLVQVSDGGMSKRYSKCFASPGSEFGTPERGNTSGAVVGFDPSSPTPTQEKRNAKPTNVRQSMDPDRLRAEMSGLVVRNVSDEDSEDEKKQQQPSKKGDEKRGKARGSRRRGGSSDSDSSDRSASSAKRSPNRRRGGAEPNKSASSGPSGSSAASGGFFGEGGGVGGGMGHKLYAPDPERVVMQFGRRDDKTFSLDFMAPINAQQALCIALTSFDVKMGME